MPFVVNATATDLNGVIGSVIIASPGSTVRVGCPFVGVPSPIVTWFHSGTELPSPLFSRVSLRNDTDNTLVIENAQKEDEGYYLCQALNTVGGNNGSAYVAIQGK